MQDHGRLFRERRQIYQRSRRVALTALVVTATNDMFDLAASPG
jgi:hypothetical protein